MKNNKEIIKRDFYKCNKCEIIKSSNDFGYSACKKNFKKSICKSCFCEATKKYVQKNKEIVCMKSKISYQKRKHSVAMKHKEYLKRDGNLERKISKTKEWRKRNLNYLLSYNNSQRSKKFKATPPWIKKQMLSHVKLLHLFRKSLQKITGKKYNIDHIFPLNGKNSCGLNVPWNLQFLTFEENCSKCNKMPKIDGILSV